MHLISALNKVKINKTDEEVYLLMAALALRYDTERSRFLVWLSRSYAWRFWAWRYSAENSLAAAPAFLTLLRLAAV